MALIKVLYHGSSDIIKKPLYHHGKPYNDYGFGFYCTENLEMAKEWSVNEWRDGYANSYTLDCSNLKILNLSDERFCLLHWLTILLENRGFDVSFGLASDAKRYLLKNFSVDYESYDIIIGYRADDSYFAFAQDFINGAISYRQLRNAMYLGNLGEQFVLKSELSFELIHFSGAEEVKKQEWYQRRHRRDKTARRQYFSLERNNRRPGDIYITQILDEGMRSDDVRLR